MQLNINTELVVGRLTKMLRVIPKKIILPVHEFVLFDVKDGKVRMMVNNGIIQVWTTINADTTDTFSFCVPLPLLLNTAKGYGEQQMTILLDKKKDFFIEIKSGKKKFNIAGINPMEFLRFKIPEKNGYMGCEAQTFRDVMSIAGTFVNPKNNMENMRGVSMSVKGGQVVLTAADSFSMARLSFSPDNATSWPDIIVPPELCAIIINLLLDSEPLTISTNTSAMYIESGCFHILSSLIDLKYPNCEQFLDKIPTGNILVNKTEMLQALSVLRNYSEETDNTIILEVDKDKMLLSAEDDGKNNSGLQRIDLSGEGISYSVRMGFNIEFIIKALTSVTTTNVFIHLPEDSKKHTFLLPEYTTEPVIDSKFLLMPLKIV